MRLRCVEKVADVPLRTFLDAGVRVCLNSDDPAYFGGGLLDNYLAVQEAFGLSVKEWRALAEAGVQGCWAAEERKAQMMQSIAAVVEEFQGKLE